MGHACGVRVDGASPRGFLRFVSLTALRAEGCGIAFGHTFGVKVQRVQRVRPAFGRLVQRVADYPSGNAYKVSVTGVTFCIIWHDKHSADWLAALASPYPASPDFPLCRGQNKTPRNTLFINGSTVSTGYSATACGGKVVAPATKGGESPSPARAVVKVLS